MYKLMMMIEEKPGNRIRIVQRIVEEKNDKESIDKKKLIKKFKERVYFDKGDNTRANLICRMAEFLKLKDIKTDKMYDLLFSEKEDIGEDLFPEIEHIHAKSRASEWDVGDDNALLNSIGNLTLLERRINNDVRADNFKDKRNGKGDGKKCYKDSKYPTILELYNMKNKNQWTPKDAEHRRETEVKAIMKYLYL